MKKKIIEAAAWAFVRRGQHERALNATLKLKSKESLNLLKQLLKYYLQQIDLLNRRKLSPGAWTEILIYFKAALKVAKDICILEPRSRCRKEVIMMGLKYLQKSNAPVEELVEFLYDARAGFSDALVKTVIKIYLNIPHLRGEEIFKIAQLMPLEERLPEIEKLVLIFIKRGDYEALRLIREKYGKLGEKIVSQSEQIVLSCLNQGKIEDATGAVSLIPDNDKKQEYYMLLGVDFVPNGPDTPTRGEY